MSDYWDQRYASGGDSGAGSRGHYAELKARLVNEQVALNQIETVLDLGCGDGYVAGLLECPDYLGVDTSLAAVELARGRHPDLRFMVAPVTVYARDAHLSLDVIRHLVDDDDYHQHLNALFRAKRVVMVWSSNEDIPGAPHDRQRRWTPNIPDEWELVAEIPIIGINSRFFVLVRA